MDKISDRNPLIRLFGKHPAIGQNYRKTMIVPEGKPVERNSFEASVVSSSASDQQNISSKAFNQLVVFPLEVIVAVIIEISSVICGFQLKM